MNRTYNFTWDYSTPPVGISLQFPYYQHRGIGEAYGVNGAVYLIDIFGHVIRQLGSNEYTASCPTYNSVGGEYPATVSYTENGNTFTVEYTVCVVNLEIAESVGTYLPLTGANNTMGWVQLKLDFANNTIASRAGISGNYDNKDLSQFLENNGPVSSTAKYCVRNNDRYTLYGTSINDWDHNHVFEHYIGFDCQRWFHTDVIFNYLSGDGWKNITVNHNVLNDVNSNNTTSYLYLDFYKDYPQSSSFNTPLVTIDADNGSETGHINIKIYATPKSFGYVGGGSSQSSYFMATYETTGTFNTEQVQITLSGCVVY